MARLVASAPSIYRSAFINCETGCRASHRTDARYDPSRMFLYAVTMPPLGTRGQFHRHDLNSQPWIGMRAVTSDRALSRRLKGYVFFRRLNRSSNEAKTVRRGDTAPSPSFELFIRLRFASTGKERDVWLNLLCLEAPRSSRKRCLASSTGFLAAVYRLPSESVSLAFRSRRLRLDTGEGRGSIKAIAFVRCGKGCRRGQCGDLIWPQSPGARCPMLGF